MRKASVFALKPGMKVGRPVYNSRGEVLLAAGAVLNEAYINRLIALGISYIYITGGPLDCAVVKDIISEETRNAAVQQLKSVLLESRESGRLVIEPEDMYSTARSFINELLGRQNLMVNLVDLRTMDNYTFAHSVNVCVLSLLTGITMGLTEDELVLLGAGALLHDLGKIKIAPEILNKPGPLTEDEYNIMKNHPRYGYEIIRQAQRFDGTAALIALEHHENYDGSGYPEGKRGDAIHKLSQITAIADRFDALTADRIYRRAYPPHEAYEMCAAAGNYLVRADIAKAFLYNIAAYPAGSPVKLNNGWIGAVLDTPKGFSRFPRVRLLFDEKGRRLAVPQEVSLLDEEKLFVMKVLNPEEVNSLLHKH